jgi:hypothetical protein
MDDEEHLKRLQQAVLKWHEWQVANRPPLADLSRANLGSVSEVEVGTYIRPFPWKAAARPSGACYWESA